MYCIAAKATDTVPPLKVVVVLISFDACNTALYNLSRYAPTKPCSFENFTASLICPTIS